MKCAFLCYSRSSCVSDVCNVLDAGTQVFTLEIALHIHNPTVFSATIGSTSTLYPYVVAVVSALVFTVGLAVVIQGLGAEGVVEGLILGLLAAIGFIATSYATTYSFEGRSLKIFLINTGYPVISYGIIGVLLAVWQ